MASAQNNIAIVTDWMYGGGSEKVVEQIHQMYPDAPIFTSYCNDRWRKQLNDQVVTGYLQWWPFAKTRKFLPLLRQWWFARLNLEKFDLVISVTGNGEAKFVKVPNGRHVCYCNTPPHFYWNKYNDYLKNPGFGKLDWLARIGLKLLVKPLRRRDYKAAQKVDYYIGNSNHISSDIKKFYDQAAKTIFPPVDIKRFKKIKPKNKKSISFIVWGRQVPDKRIDVAIEACNELKLPLTIIGIGSYINSLKDIAGPTITFTGWVEDEDLEDYIANASAFIFPSYEDFGIVSVEAMAAGLPVIAYKAGGALDYVMEGETGLFFDDQSAESLIKTLEKFNPKDFDSKKITKFAGKFSEDNFQKNLESAIDAASKS